MTNAFSRLHNAFETWSFKYNCYEAVHPWTPHCTDSALELGLTVFGEAFKLYTPLYLFSQLMQRRYDYNSFKNTGQSIIRSTTFISANAFFALLFFCSTGYITGKFYYYAVAYLPAFLASSMAVMIEKPNRRSSLAFYVANVASDALYRISVARGYLKPVKNGQVYIFTLSIATIMWLAKKHGFEDDPLSAAIKLIVGPEEAAIRLKREIKSSIKKDENFSHNDNQLEVMNKNEIDLYRKNSITTPFPPSITSLNLNTIERLYNILSWFKFILNAKHRFCPHREKCSCLNYVLKASIRSFMIGSVAQLSLKTIPKLSSNILKLKNDDSNNNNNNNIIIINAFNLIKNLSLSTTDFDSIIKVGLFLSTFSGLYKLTNCWLRWSLDSESKPINCFLSALIAGPALLLYPSPTIASYVLWKCLEALFNESVRLELIKNKNLFIIILYGLATSQLFYSALMDPRYMKKSYMAFLHRMSKHKLHMVNRSVLDVFGTEASSGYEEFFPDLHPKYMSKAFLSSIWIWMIEQKSVIATKVS